MKACLERKNTTKDTQANIQDLPEHHFKRFREACLRLLLIKQKQQSHHHHANTPLILFGRSLPSQQMDQVFPT